MTILTASEKDIQKAVLEYLRVHPRVAWAERLNVGAVKGEYKGKTRFVRFGFPGLSDIIGQMKDGRFLAIEVKRDDGKVSWAQFQFLATISDNGGVSGVARSVDDAERIVSE